MATIYAITPLGIGKRPGVRAIKDTWELQGGEAFSVTDPPTNTQVLSDNGLALREMTPGEISSEKSDDTDKKAVLTEQDEFLKDTLRDPLFATLKRASSSAIDNFVATRFNTFSPQQQEVIKFLVRTAILTLRKMK